MRMNQVTGRGLQKLAHLQDSMRMAKVVEWQRKARKPLRPGTCFQFALFAAYNDLAVASLAKPARQFQQLALAAAQIQAGVDMSDLQGS
jgi:hypothetical protein